MVWKHLYSIIYQGVQENIVVLIVTIFCVQTKSVVTSKFVVQLLHFLKVKELYFFSSPIRNKENTEDF